MTEDVGFSPDLAGQHGCAWFLLGEDPVASPLDAPVLASVAGGAPIRVAHLSDLPAKVTWWTNMNQAQAWMVGRFERFKPGGWFGPQLPAIWMDAGLPNQEDQLVAAIPGWSEAGCRVVEWLSSFAAAHGDGSPWEWGEGSIPEAIAHRLGWTATPDNPVEVLRAAYVASIRWEWPSGSLAGHRRITLLLPPSQHARRLSRLAVPHGSWQPLGEDDWPTQPASRRQFVHGANIPLLLQVDNITWHVGASIEGERWLGQRGRPFSGAAQEPIWLTGEEVRELLNLADADILAGYKATSMVEDAWPYELSHDPSEEPLRDTARSQGLLSSAIWRAGATPVRHPRHRTEDGVTSRAIWRRLADRRACAHAASILTQRGWRVLEYGDGQVSLAVDPAASIQDLARACRDAGVLLPGLVARQVPLPKDADPEHPVDCDHWLKRMGDESVVDLDRLCLPWPGPGLRALLQGSASRLMQLQAPSPAWGEWWKSALRRQAQVSVRRIKVEREARRS